MFNFHKNYLYDKFIMQIYIKFIKIVKKLLSPNFTDIHYFNYYIIKNYNVIAIFYNEKLFLAFFKEH